MMSSNPKLNWLPQFCSYWPTVQGGGQKARTKVLTYWPTFPSLGTSTDRVGLEWSGGAVTRKLSEGQSVNVRFFLQRDFLSLSVLSLLVHSFIFGCLSTHSTVRKQIGFLLSPSLLWSMDEMSASDTKSPIYSLEPWPLTVLAALSAMTIHIQYNP